MFKNYLTIALRNILRYKTYSFINIAGLAVGLTAFFLMALYVLHELSYDRHHEKAKQIYRMGLEGSFGGNTFKNRCDMLRKSHRIRF